MISMWKKMLVLALALALLPVMASAEICVGGNPPVPGVCYFIDADGDCTISPLDYRVPKYLVRGANMAISAYPYTGDLFDLDGDGTVSPTDVYLMKLVWRNMNPALDGVPTDVGAYGTVPGPSAGETAQLTAQVTDADGTPRAGIGVVFTINPASTATAVLHGRDPAVSKGCDYIGSDSVFELTNSIADGGLATIGVTPSKKGTLVIGMFVPGDARKGVSDFSNQVTITVPNSPPVISAIADITVQTGSVVMFVATATDADGDALTYSASGLPASATFDPATRVFTWDADEVGNHVITFTVDDGEAADSEDVLISVYAPAPPEDGDDQGEDDDSNGNGPSGGIRGDIECKSPNTDSGFLCTGGLACVNGTSWAAPHAQGGVCCSVSCSVPPVVEVEGDETGEGGPEPEPGGETPEPRPNCGDMNPCTTDSYDELFGVCQHISVENGIVCYAQGERGVCDFGGCAVATAPVLPAAAAGTGPAPPTGLAVLGLGPGLDTMVFIALGILAAAIFAVFARRFAALTAVRIHNFAVRVYCTTVNGRGIAKAARK